MGNNIQGLWPTNDPKDPNFIPVLSLDGMLSGGRGIAVAQPGQSESLGPDPRDTSAFKTKVDLLRLTGDDRVAQMATIALAISREANTELGLDSQTPPVKAVVSFGQGGTYSTFECDFINGLLLSVPASMITLAAVIDVPRDAFLVQTRVNAFCTYMTRGGCAAVQRTLRAPAIAAGTEVIQDLPSFATSLRLLAKTPGATITVNQYQDKGGSLLVATTVVVVNPPYLHIPIANDTRFIGLHNTGASPVDLQAIYDLCL